MSGKFAIAVVLVLVGVPTAGASVDPRFLSLDIVPEQYDGLTGAMPLFAAMGGQKDFSWDEDFPTGRIDPLAFHLKHPRGYSVPLDNPIGLVNHNVGSSNTGSRTSDRPSFAQDILAAPIASSVSPTSSIARADPALRQINNLAPVFIVPNQVIAVANASVPGQVLVYEALNGSSNSVYVGSTYDLSLWQAQRVAETPPVTVTPITTPPVTVPPVTTSPVTVPPVTVTPITTPSVTIPSVTIPSVTTPAVTLPSVTTPVVTTPAVTLPLVTTPVVTTPVVTTPAVTFPSATTPVVTTPAVAIPADTTAVAIPSVTTPVVTTPAVTLPLVTTPVVTTPVVTTPVVTTPAVTFPSATTPVVTTPAVAIPADTTAVAIPADTTAVAIPSMTTPVVTTPAVTLPVAATSVMVQSAVASPLLTSTLVPSDPTTLDTLVTAAPISIPFAQARLSVNFALSDNVRIARGTTPEISTFDFVNRERSEAPVSVNAVPEPTTWAMMLIGLAGLALYKWRRSCLPQ